MVGVECDGRTYHSSPSARDRDRTRQEVLENLGWSLVRLWSTDYFIDAKSAIDKIDTELTNLLERWRQSLTEMSEGENSEPEDSSREISESSPFENPEQTPEVEQDDSEADFGDTEYPASKYFDQSHRWKLKELAQEIIKDYECIDEKVLALEIANRHGLTRTSRNS